jgi:hypothetical protein
MKRKNGCKEKEKKRGRERENIRKGWRKGLRRLVINKDNHGIEEETE